MIRKIEKW